MDGVPLAEHRFNDFHAFSRTFSLSISIALLSLYFLPCVFSSVTCFFAVFPVSACLTVSCFIFQ